MNLIYDIHKAQNVKRETDAIWNKVISHRFVSHWLISYGEPMKK